MRILRRLALSISKLYQFSLLLIDFQDKCDNDNLKGETTNEPNDEDEEVGQQFSLSLSTLLPDRENKPQTCCSSHFHCFNFQDKCYYDNLKGETTNEPNENGEEVGQSEDEHQYCKLAIAKPEAKKVLMNKEIKTEKQGQRKGPGAFEEYDGEGEDVGGETEGEQATEDNDQ